MMSSWLEGRAILLYQAPVDFRKQQNGLMQLTETELLRDPMDGTLYLFRNRQKDKLKVLVWDRNGYVLLYKRLEKGRFDFPMDEKGKHHIGVDELEMLISGMPIIRLRKRKELPTAGDF